MKKICLAVIMAMITFVAMAEVKLPSILGSNMVLQRNTEVNLWGTADKGRAVTVVTSWNGEKYKTKAADDGSWSLKVSTGEAGGPYTITISDGDKLTLENILLGEVWICGGQSNMEMPVGGLIYQPVEGSAEAILYSSYETPNVRFFNVPRVGSVEPQEHCGGEWLVSNPKNVASFSAIGYFFGKALTQAMDGIPIGLIAANWGGTRIECWMTEEVIDATPDINYEIAKNGTHVTSAPEQLYNGIIHPITNFTAKGFIWYQGCSNRLNWYDYKNLMVSLVKFWRDAWGDDTMPFYYTQLAPYAYEGATLRSLPLVIEAQYQAMREIAYSGIVSTTDIGNRTCIHPSEKRQVGERLAYLALANDYGIAGLPSPAPTYKDMTLVEDEKRGKVMVLSFNNLPEIYSQDDPNSFKGYDVEGRRTPKGFEIAGADKVWYKAQAKFKGWENKIEVWSEHVPEPVAVRYAFCNFSEDANVVTLVGQPLAPFRTDNWEIPAEEIGEIR